MILVNSLTFFVHARGRGVLLSSTMGGKNAVAILGGAPMGNARDAAGGGSELRGAGELVGDDSVDGVSRMSAVGAMGKHVRVPTMDPASPARLLYTTRPSANAQYAHRGIETHPFMPFLQDLPGPASPTGRLGALFLFGLGISIPSSPNTGAAGFLFLVAPAGATGATVDAAVATAGVTGVGAAPAILPASDMA